MADQAVRVLIAAQAIALLYGDQWGALDAEAKRHYRKEGLAAVTALAKHDKELHASRIRAGWEKNKRAGLRSVGRPAPPDTEAKRVARQMILERQTTRTIREATGLGNSTISSIKLDIQRGQADAPSNHPDPAISAAAGVPV